MGKRIAKDCGLTKDDEKYFKALDQYGHNEVVVPLLKKVKGLENVLREKDQEIASLRSDMVTSHVRTELDKLETRMALIAESLDRANSSLVDHLRWPFKWMFQR